MKNKDIELTIPKSCHHKWQSMPGDLKSRFCSECRTNIYNFSEMTQDEIDSVMSNNSKVCARMTADTKACVSKFVLTKHYFKNKNFKAALFCIASIALSPITNALDMSKEGNNQQPEKNTEEPGNIEITSPEELASTQDNEPEKVGEIFAPDFSELLIPDENTPNPDYDIVRDNKTPDRVGSVAVRPEPEFPPPKLKINELPENQPENKSIFEKIKDFLFK